MFVKPLAAALASAGLVVASLSAHAVEYSLFDLGSLGGSYARTFATGINNSGQVVGYGYQYDPSLDGSSATNDYQAFVTGANGQGLTGLGMLAGDQWSKAAAINDSGQVVGTSTHASGTQNAGWSARPARRPTSRRPMAVRCPCWMPLHSAPCSALPRTV